MSDDETIVLKKNHQHIIRVLYAILTIGLAMAAGLATAGWRAGQYVARMEIRQADSWSTTMQDTWTVRTERANNGWKPADVRQVQREYRE